MKVIDSVRLLNSKEEATRLIVNLLEKTRPVVLSFVNAHAYNLCWNDVEFSQALLNSDIVLRDGIGMQLLYRSLGIDSGANLNGTDYIPALLDQLRGKKIALLGTNNPYLKKAADELSKQGHNIVLADTGYHSNEHYLQTVHSTKPDIIILGMGMPKQEKLSVFLKEHVADKCLIINGGAIIDFWGKKVGRAPFWIRKLNMEWLFRLILEPRRLFSRYVIGNYVFLKRTTYLRSAYAQTVRSADNSHGNINVKVVKKMDQHIDEPVEL